jgi:hypothetical protein
VCITRKCAQILATAFLVQTPLRSERRLNYSLAMWIMMAQDHLIEVVECTKPVEAVCAREVCGTDWSVFTDRTARRYTKTDRYVWH